MRFTIIFAILLLVSAVNAQSTRALQSFENGLALSRSGDHVSALAEFETTLTAIERDGATERFFAKVRYNLGVSLYQLRRFDAAIPQLEKALDYSQNQYEKAHYALGLIEFERGNISAAREAFSNAVSLNNRNGEAWFDLAFAYLAAGDRHDAEKAFAKALKHGAAERVTILNNLGVLLAIDGKYAEALVQFEAAINAGDRTGASRDNIERCRKLLNAGQKELVAGDFILAKRGRSLRT